MAGRHLGQDVDSIQLGDDFVEVITRAVGSCDVLLAFVTNVGNEAAMSVKSAWRLP